MSLPTTPEPGLVRNRDSWRIARYVDNAGTDVLVQVEDRFALWPVGYVQDIEPHLLDAALMDLRDKDRHLYDIFLAVMLGAERAPSPAPPPRPNRPAR